MIRRGDYNGRRGDGQIVRRPGRCLALAALASLAVACLRSTATPAPRLADLVAGFDRDAAPYYPFSASERGLHRIG
jgi:hypothetical protein